MCDQLAGVAAERKAILARPCYDQVTQLGDCATGSDLSPTTAGYLSNQCLLQIAITNRDEGGYFELLPHPPFHPLGLSGVSRAI